MKLATVAALPVEKLKALMEPYKYEKICLSCWLGNIAPYADESLG